MKPIYTNYDFFVFLSYSYIYTTHKKLASVSGLPHSEDQCLNMFNS